jgi:hypothetical protein
MVSAHVVEVDDLAVGLVLSERGGFRFFAAVNCCRRLEGALFRTVDHAARAAREVMRDERARGPSRAVTDHEIEAWAPIL